MNNDKQRKITVKFVIKLLVSPIIVASAIIVMFIYYFILGYYFLANMLKKIHVNLSKVFQLVFSTAFIGACSYGIYYILAVSEHSTSGKALISFLITLLILLIGYFGLLESLMMLKYPNVEKLTRKKDVPRLIRALKYDDRKIQNQTATALEEIGDERARIPLKKYHDEVTYLEDFEYNRGRPSGPYLQ